MPFHPCPRNHAQDIRAATGQVLCVPCIRRLEHNLRALPGLHQECLHHILKSPRRRNPTKVTGTRKRDPLNFSALDARDNVLAVLESWSGIVVDTHGTTAPARTVPHLARFLVRHLAWLTAQPPAADLADEIEGLRGDLRHAIDPGPGDAPGPLLRECVMDGCTGTIDASPRNSGNAGHRSISCTSGHSWEMTEWLTLRHLMARQRKDAA